MVTQESINKQSRITKVKIRSMSNAKHKIVSSYRFNLFDCTRQPYVDMRWIIGICLCPPAVPHIYL